MEDAIAHKAARSRELEFRVKWGFSKKGCNMGRKRCMHKCEYKHLYVAFGERERASVVLFKMQ